MVYSELKILENENLSFSDKDCALMGEMDSFPICIADIGKSFRFIITLFVKIPLQNEGEVSQRINKLSMLLPKNAVLSQKYEVSILQVVLSSHRLFQETMDSLYDFISGITGFLKEKGFPPTVFQRELCCLCSISPIAGQSVKKLPQKGEVTNNRFDKRSLFGLIGAVIGAIACAVIMTFAISLDLTPPEEPETEATSSTQDEYQPPVMSFPEINIGQELAAWAMGGIAAAVILIDYRFFAKKTDIFGIISCSALTLLTVFSGTVFCGFRHLYILAREDGIHASLPLIIGNIDYYNDMYPVVGTELNYLLLKGLFSAIVASGLYYLWYFRKHSDTMYEGS